MATGAAACVAAAALTFQGSRVRLCQLAVGLRRAGSVSLSQLQGGQALERPALATATGRRCHLKRAQRAVRGARLLLQHRESRQHSGPGAQAAGRRGLHTEAAHTTLGGGTPRQQASALWLEPHSALQC